MQILRGGTPVNLIGTPPEIGQYFSNFELKNERGEIISNSSFIDKKTLISVVPDLNTPVCNIQTKRFNENVDEYKDIRFITISNNTVSEQKEWCAAENVHNMEVLSDKLGLFGKVSGLYIPDAGFLARAIFILDETGKIIYKEVVADLHNEPNYEKALDVLNNNK